MIDKNTIPEYWEVKKLGDVCKLKNGFAFKSSDYSNGGVPVIRISDINSGIVSSRKAVRVNANTEYENYLVENNDLLVAMSGATTGKFGIFKSEEKAYQNQRVGKFKILDNNVLEQQFLYYQLHALKRQIEKDAYGGAQPNISSSKIEQMEIVLPPLSEQQEIVAKIEELLSELDKGKEQLETAWQQLKVYRQAVLKWAFEGKLTNPEVKEGELPEGWEWVNLKEVSDKIFDGPFGSNLKSADYIEEGVRVIRLENIGPLEFRDEYKTFVSEEKYESIKKHTVGAGNIIFSSFIMDEIRVVVLPKFIQTAINKADCFCVRVNNTKANENYIAYYLSTEHVYNQLVNEVHGATRPRINTSQLKATVVPLPPLEEQNQIVQEIESRLSVCDKVEETITQSLQQSETLRQSILKKAFEGKLVIEKVEVTQPRNIYFYQVQLLAYLIHYSKLKGIHHGEMTAAKYAYLLHKIYGINTHYNFNRWHLGPYAPEMKKVVNNKKFFLWKDNGLAIVNPDTILNYANPVKEQVEKAIDELSQIIEKLPGKNLTHKTELFATVCKVIEDIQSTDLQVVRASMEKWKIDLPTTHFKSKAEKFNVQETEECLQALIKKGWNKKLIDS